MNNKSVKILHIAPQNFAGMPYDFVKMHRANGIYSHLITMYKNTLNFEEDISLNLKLPINKFAKKWRDSKLPEKPETLSKLKYYKPKNLLENIFFKIRDFKNKNVIEKVIYDYKLFDYDIYHFDGGMDFYRNLSFVKRLEKLNKKIVCCYFGSDLRTRGIFKELENISDLNLTVEFDHLSIHDNIHYLFFPFDTSQYDFVENNNDKIRIIHSPTNRAFKGTEKILKIISEVEKERKIEFLLIENMNRNEVLKIKSTCDLAIDQVGGELGGSGYGKNSIENLSMGIPTITEFTEEYLKFIPENPFVHSTITTLKESLINLIDNKNLRKDIARKGRLWVEKYHSFQAVNEKLMNLYFKHHIL